MAWTVLRLTPKPEHWADLQMKVRDDAEAIHAIVAAANRSLLPVHFDMGAMLMAELQQTVENDCHSRLIHPDVSVRVERRDPYAWPVICAGMTEHQAVHFKLAYSDKY